MCVHIVQKFYEKHVFFFPFCVLFFNVVVYDFGMCCPIFGNPFE